MVKFGDPLDGHRLGGGTQFQDDSETPEISVHAEGDPCSRVCEVKTLHSAPINMSGNFPVHMSAESPSNFSPNPSEVISKVSEL